MHEGVMQRLESLKTIGPNGQISLGKQFAGRPVIVEQREPGVWLIRTATIVPDNEAWIHNPKAAVDLAAALNWSAANPPSGDNTDAYLAKLDEQT
jgi:hypothetical protein